MSQAAPRWLDSSHGVRLNVRSSKPASTVQDQQPTSHPDADPENGKPPDPAGVALPASEDVSLEVPAFDPDAFEQAAAQFRPSWDDIEPERLSSDVIADEFAARGVAPAPVPSDQPFVSRGTGETDAMPPEVIVPRPPRTPQLDYTGMRTQEAADDLGLAIPKKSMRGVWITVAVFVSAAAFAFALTRGIDSDEPAPVVKAPAAEDVIQQAAPAAAVPAEPTAPAPVVREEVVPPVQTAPEIKPESPKPAPIVAAPKEASTPRHRADVTHARGEKTSRTSKAKRPTTETRTTTPTSHSSTPKKIKRGAGFVSTNPY